MPTKKDVLKNAAILAVLLSFATLFACGVSGCGRMERAKYARLADHVDESVKELDRATPANDLRKPGLAALKAETEGVRKSLPEVPEADKLKPIPFVDSVNTGNQARDLALQAGAPKEVADAKGLEAATGVVADQNEKVDAAIRDYQAAAAEADASAGLAGTIVNGIGSVLGVLGPWGSGLAALLGLGTAIVQTVKKKKVVAQFTATVRGVENGAQEIKKQFAEKGAAALTSDAVVDALYTNLKNMHETLSNVADVAAQITKIKADMRAGS